MKIVFMGTGEIALPSFQMVAQQHQLAGLVTQPDRPVGRHAKLQPPRIKELAVEAGVPVLQPERVRNPKALEEVAALDPELIVVMAYGQILPPALLELPTRGCINVHASLLPRHRGASCIQAAIAAGDAVSGVTIMHVAKGLDTGDIILQHSLALEPGETGGSLHDRLAELAPGVLNDALRALERGAAPRTPQEESAATYAPKLERTDGQIDWTRGSEDLERQIRAYDPWPGSYTWYRDSRGRERRLKIFPPVELVAGAAGAPGEVLAAEADGLTVAAGEGALILRDVQAEGGRRIPVAAFLAGHSLGAGAHFFSLEQGEN